MKLMQRIWYKTVNLGKLQIMIICISSLLFSIMTTGYNALSTSHYKYMVLTLNYEGAKDGLTPEGGKFDITQIKSDIVLEDAIAKLGDKRLNVSNVRDRISIDSKMPKSALDKVVGALQAGTNYSYAPAEFSIYYSQKDKFGINNTVQFLEALSDSYTDFFNQRYSNNNTILQYDGNEDYSGYDYDEICRIFTDRIDSMIKYLGSQQSENTNFVSSDTGYSYSELINILINIRDIDVAKLNAYVMQNKISKSRDTLLRKNEFLINDEERKYDSANNTSNIINDSLAEYDARITGVIFVPALDERKEFYMGRTKTGLDNLVKKSYDEGEKAVDFKKTIDEYEEKYNLFSEASVSSASQNEVADSMITNINEHLKEISDKTVKTDNEFIEIKTNKYLSFRLPKYSHISFSYFMKMFIMGLIMTFAACKLWTLFYKWAKNEITFIKRKIVK